MRATLLFLLMMSAVTESTAAQRHFVSASGTSNLSCSITQPCRQFSDALAVVDPGGEVIVLTSGGYGTRAITQSVSIIAAPGVYAGITVFAGTGVSIASSGVQVALRGLTINGQGGFVGVSMLQTGQLVMELVHDRVCHAQCDHAQFQRRHFHRLAHRHIARLCGRTAWRAS